MPSLLVVSGPAEGDYYLLGQAPVVIGRDEACPIQIVDDLVSRRHLEIRRDGSGPAYGAIDQESSNGTYLNDRRITGWTSLRDGDVIRIGRTELLYSAVDFADRETAFQHYRSRDQRGRATRSD